MIQEPNLTFVSIMDELIFSHSTLTNHRTKAVEPVTADN